MKVAVVGAGLAGLSAACHLAGRGHDVTVLERDTLPGGRAGLVCESGYRLDTGPSVLTMPDIIAATFAAAGADMDAHLTLAPVDPMYRACFADGSTLYVRHGREAMAEEIRSVCGPAEAAAFGRFCDWLGDLFSVEMPSFIDRNFDSPLDLVHPPEPLARLVRLGGLRRLSSVVERHFADERLRRIFSFQALYAGLSPFEALAIYCAITYMDTVRGVFFPVGGMHALPRGLAAAAEKAGTELRYSTPVAAVLRRPDGRVRGVRLAGGSEAGGGRGGGRSGAATGLAHAGDEIAADAVVVTADLPVAYRTLLGGLEAPRTARRGRYSPSCVLWLAGARGSPPAGAAHHNVHFGAGWRESFRALLRDGTRMPDPSILVSVPTLSDPGLAPAGATALSALEPVPNLTGRIDWDRERERIRESLLRRVAGLGYPVEVEVERFVDPLGWERLGCEQGTPFGLAHLFRQTGPFRPANVDRRAPGLVFAGSSTVPGVGVPMVLLSGRLAAERVEQMDRDRR